jgi:hypothetical protein
VSCIEFSDDRPEIGPAERNFAGMTVDNNTFWAGPRTHFDFGLQIGSKGTWGDNGPFARGASFTNNTTGGIQTRVHAGVAISGMIDAVVHGNTSEYLAEDQHPEITELGCPHGGVLLDAQSGPLAPGSQEATTVTGMWNCNADHLPVGGLERIEIGPSQTLVGADSGEPIVAWGQQMHMHNPLDHRIEVLELREIKAMGSNVARLVLQFKDFIDETCTSANATAVNELETTLRRANENGIYLYLTGLGSYDGDDDDPPCYVNATQEERWNAHELFWETVAQATSGDPAVLALDLLNEPVLPSIDTVCWTGPPPFPDAPGCRWGWGGVGDTDNMFVQNITRTAASDGRPPNEIATEWITRMRDAIRAYDQDHLITLSCLAFQNCAIGLSPAQLASLLDITSVHIYPTDCTPDPNNCAFWESQVEKGGTDPLVYERNLLTAFWNAGDPVIVSETFTFAGKDITAAFLDESVSRSNGWIGNWGDKTMSQHATSAEIGDVVHYWWAELFQRFAPRIAPCGTCQP